jgi:predicted amidohydrolase YtcJ
MERNPMRLRQLVLQCSLIASSAFGAVPIAHADTIIDNANGYTLDAKGDVIQFASLAFDDQGRIVAVGTAREVAEKVANKVPHAHHVDMQGRTVLPGLIDAHGHVFGLGQMLTELDLSGTTSLQQALQDVKGYARANAGRAWVRGRGWNQENWKLGRFPTAKELDAVVSDRPAWFERVDGHAGWANSRALALAGITDQTPDPAGGKIVRDADGHATGVLVDAAKGLMEKVLPQPTEQEGRVMLDRALQRMASVGLTSAHDAGISAAQDKLYRDYADHGKLTARIYAMIGGTGADFDQLARNGPLDSYGHDMYALRAVKLYADGALGSRGAALLAPYSDDPHSHGLLFHSDEEVNFMISKAMQKGYQVNIHAIGDASNRQILDAFARNIPVYHTADNRNRIEHAQIVTLEDIPRFKTIGIIPSMQPTHATSDKNMAEQRVGHERIKGAYAWRTYLAQGSRIACGSDFPVESPNPFFGIHAAVTRQDAGGNPIAGWYPEQEMSLKEAFRCFTLDAAYAGHQEKTLGSLEVGKYADFIVIDRDLFKMSPYDIYKTAVLETWVAGHPVYKKK